MAEILDQFRALSTPAKVIVGIGVGILLVGLFIVALLFIAVAGAFVLDLGESTDGGVEQPPAASFAYEFDDTTTTWPTQTVTEGDSAVISDVDVGDTVRIIRAADDETSVSSRQTIQ